MVEEISSNVENKSEKKGFLVSMRENPWIVSTVVLGVLVLILVFISFGVGSTGNVVSEKDASQKLLDLYTSQGVEGLSVLSVEKVSGVYQVNFNYEGQTVPIFITVDGSMVGSLSEFPEGSSSSGGSNSYSEEISYTEEENKMIQDFSACLYDKGVRVYYAEWCGYCHLLIDTFGGIENAGKMMVQCQTADGQAGTGAELCSAEGDITGFPTIKIGGEKYQGDRTFEGFARVTGCVAPVF